VKRVGRRGGADGGQGANDYEAERLARIQRNKDRMAELGLSDAVAAVLQERAAQAGASGRASGGRKRRQPGGGGAGEGEPAPPRRSSARLAGGAVEFPLLLDLPAGEGWGEEGAVELDAQPAALGGNRRRRQVVVQQPRGKSGGEMPPVRVVEGPLDEKAHQREEKKMKKLDQHNLMRLSYMTEKAMR